MCQFLACGLVMQDTCQCCCQARRQRVFWLDNGLWRRPGNAEAYQAQCQGFYQKRRLIADRILCITSLSASQDGTLHEAVLSSNSQGIAASGREAPPLLSRVDARRYSAAK